MAMSTTSYDSIVTAARNEAMTIAKRLSDQINKPITVVVTFAIDDGPQVPLVDSTVRSGAFNGMDYVLRQAYAQDSDGI